jgi:predicted PurR-regulated permease PerM
MAVSLAALVSIDATGRALLAPLAFVLIHLTESNIVTPTLLGRHLPVNTVAIFLGLLFFGWLWGIPGAVLAVPLTVCAKLVCDHVPSLAQVGNLLDNRARAAARATSHISTVRPGPGHRRLP